MRADAATAEVLYQLVVRRDSAIRDSSSHRIALQSRYDEDPHALTACRGGTDRGSSP